MKKTLQHRLILAAVPTILALSPAVWAGVTRTEIQMPDASRQVLLKSKEKTEVKDGVTAIIYQDGKEPKEHTAEIGSRGQSTLKFVRKNYSLKYTDTHHGKKLLTAGAYDPLLIKNRLAYEIFRQVGVPALETRLTELTINGESQGLYMVTESPEEMMLKKEDTQVVLRRRYDDRIELKKANKHLSDDDAQAYVQALADLHSQAASLKGQKLVELLQSKLNLKAYFRMLAVNYVIHNGDNTDEVFFAGYKTADGQIKFQAVPWDLDDTFSEEMHMEKNPLDFNHGRNKVAQQQMLFGFESRLDRAISENQELLNLYFAEISEVLEILKPDLIAGIAQKVEDDLTPYLFVNEILEAGTLDKARKAHDPSESLQSIRDKRDELNNRVAAMKIQVTDIQRDHSIDRTHKTNPLKKLIGTLFNKLMFKITEKDPKDASKATKKDKVATQQTDSL